MTRRGETEGNKENQGVGFFRKKLCSLCYLLFKCVLGNCQSSRRRGRLRQHARRVRSPEFTPPLSCGDETPPDFRRRRRRSILELRDSAAERRMIFHPWSAWIYRNQS